MFSKFFFFIAFLSFVAFLIVFLLMGNMRQRQLRWQVQSIDTMKYSRDLSRQKLSDLSFNKVIDQQVNAIAQTGANYVAIDTPYDEEFIPILSRWVAAARRYHLHVWFRGNFSGWEQWFGYAPIGQTQHLQLTQQFILNHGDLFQDGDIFTSCPECENGAHLNYGDQAQLAQYKQFLLQEHAIVQNAFDILGKNVITNYYSMSKTAADAIMDKEMVEKMGGVIVIDHYVATPEQLGHDIKQLADRTGAKIVLGEFGAPIPDLTGPMTEEQQKNWIADAFTQLSSIPQLIGVNYWVNVDGSTALWDTDGAPRPAVQVITSFYSTNNNINLK